MDYMDFVNWARKNADTLDHEALGMEGKMIALLSEKCVEFHSMLKSVREQVADLEGQDAMFCTFDQIVLGIDQFLKDLGIKKQSNMETTVMTQRKFDAGLRCLTDNGIEADEAETVLQALCYILLDEETEQFMA
jgi:hypothetical protein